MGTMTRTRRIGAWAGLAVSASAAVAMAGCSSSADESPVTHVSSGLVIRDATVVDTRDGRLAPNMAVVIDGGSIRQVVPDAQVRLAAGVPSVAASGKFVVPGFLDLHTHASATLGNPPSDFPVLLANGVTGVREASGTPATIAAARQRNAAVAAGTLDSPEVLAMPSVIFGGQSPTAAGAAQFVRDRKAEGADFVKVVGGTRDALLAILTEAKAQELPVAGHLALSLSAVESSNAGWRSFEHLGAGIGLLLDCAADQAGIRAAMLANPAPPAPNVVNPRLYDGNAWAPYYQRVLDTYSDAQCRSVAQALAANGTWQPATLIRLRTQSFGDAAAYRTDPNLRYVDKTRRALWESIAQQYATVVTPAARATLQRFYALQLRAVGLLKEAGAPILAGSDLGGGLVIPGFSLHQEFRELAAAGLTPLEVLQATTLNGARFLGRTATMGTVEAGKNADLVLLDADPTADVANLSRISAVFVRGKYYPRSALDRLLSDVAAAYDAQAVRDVASAADPTHTH